MIWIKTALFIGTIVTVRYIFSFVNHDGDQKINKMKEIINFTEYLRVYSCDMKMSFEEIYEKYGLSEMEVTDEVFNSKYAWQFTEAENRLHSIKAVMAATLGNLFIPTVNERGN